MKTHGEAPIRFHLRDRNNGMSEAWTAMFRGTPEVEVSTGDILEASADAIVSPANSFGFMDGGIDLAYSGRFGWGVQERLQALLQAEHAGELPVGQAVVVETMDEGIPFLISAPTMRVPMVVAETANTYLAFRAAILAVRRHNREGGLPIRSVLCPGLGTATGRMPYDRCARQMHAAFLACCRETVFPDRLGPFIDRHYALLE